MADWQKFVSFLVVATHANNKELSYIILKAIGSESVSISVFLGLSVPEQYYIWTLRGSSFKRPHTKYCHGTGCPWFAYLGRFLCEGPNVDTKMRGIPLQGHPGNGPPDYRSSHVWLRSRVPIKAPRLVDHSNMGVSNNDLPHLQTPSSTSK